MKVNEEDERGVAGRKKCGAIGRREEKRRGSGRKKVEGRGRVGKE